MKKLLGTTLCLFVFTSLTFSQTVIGTWKTIDDETGKPKSHVQLYEENGKLYGKVVKILNPDKQNAVCDLCDDDKKDQPIMGMVIVNDLEEDDGKWSGGKILDPNKGKYYRCKLWVDEEDPNKLNVRGYIAFLYRTQNWYRVDD